jgi:hypothetical protein
MRVPYERDYSDRRPIAGAINTKVRHRTKPYPTTSGLPAAQRRLSVLDPVALSWGMLNVEEGRECITCFP